MTTERLNAVDPSMFHQSVARAAQLLREGLVVAFPTETVYGLGADALNANAIAAVFVAKGRPADNPLIVHVAGPEWLPQCAVPNDRAWALAEAFMPGPITLVLPATDAVPAIARAGLPTVAVRVPDHPVARALIEQAGPLVAPSANRSGRPSPTTAHHVLQDLDGVIAAVLDGGDCRVGIESTVVDLSGPRAMILRPGAITAEAIETVLGESLALRMPGGGAPPRSPGMKYRHYAPAARILLHLGHTPPPLFPEPSGRIVLTTGAHMDRFPGEEVRPLTTASLYAMFREADARGIAEIVIFALPEELDAGLLDRLMKAAE